MLDLAIEKLNEGECLKDILNEYELMSFEVQELLTHSCKCGCELSCGCTHCECENY